MCQHLEYGGHRNECQFELTLVDSKVCVCSRRDNDDDDDEVGLSRCGGRQSERNNEGVRCCRRR